MVKKSLDEYSKIIIHILEYNIHLTFNTSNFTENILEYTIEDIRALSIPSRENIHGMAAGPKKLKGATAVPVDCRDPFKTKRIKMQRSHLMTAIWTDDIRTVIRLTDMWPQLLTESNAKGETPMREYLNGGGRQRSIIANITPHFSLDNWDTPSWFGASQAWTKAAW